MTDLALGLMSGTSMDGVDVAIMNVHTHELLFSETLPYPKRLREQLFAVADDQEFNVHFFAHLNQELGIMFAKVAKHALNSITHDLRSLVRVIGSHGQTVCHHIANSVPYTWQMGCPMQILQTCALPVVFDFRTKNVVQGGQGAPLAPLYHQQVFAQQDEPLAIINIGGISNISLLQPNKALVGYDIGPGNCLMDAWAAVHLNVAYDRDGNWAETGQVSHYLLQSLMKEPFVNLSHPKSIGKEYYSLKWLQDYLVDKQYTPADVQASLLAFTTKSIAKQVKLLLSPGHRVLICGGGAQNTYLMKMLQFYLPAYQVQSTDSLGFSAKFLEAMMIAWLAWSRINHKKHDLSMIMGGEDQQTLGVICE